MKCKLKTYKEFKDGSKAQFLLRINDWFLTNLGHLSTN